MKTRIIFEIYDDNDQLIHIEKSPFQEVSPAFKEIFNSTIDSNPYCNCVGAAREAYDSMIANRNVALSERDWDFIRFCLENPMTPPI